MILHQCSYSPYSIIAHSDKGNIKASNKKNAPTILNAPVVCHVPSKLCTEERIMLCTEETIKCHAENRHGDIIAVI